MDLIAQRQRFQDQFKGVWPALPTPMTTGGAVDTDAIGRVVDHVIDGGVNGLWLMGSGAGFASLTRSQRRQALGAAIEANAGRLPFVVGVGSTAIGDVQENLAEAVEWHPIAAFVVAPYYYLLDDIDIERFYLALADASTVPIVVYHNDTNSKIQISVETVARLSEHPNIVGIKDSTCSIGYHLRLLERFGQRQDFSIIHGDDYGLATGSLLGTKAFVAAAPVLAPELVVSLHRAIQVGDLAKSRALQTRLTKLLNLYAIRGGSDSGFLAAQSGALHLLGLTGPTPPEPCRGLDEHELGFARDVLIGAGLDLPTARLTA